MAASIESPTINKGSPSLMGSSTIFSPSSDKRFWSNLQSRVDKLIEKRNPLDQTEKRVELIGGSKRFKEDSMLLMRGFDSVAQSLSDLSNNLENALQGARDLARPPTLTEMFHATLEKAKTEHQQFNEENKDEKEEEDNEEIKRGLKRKLDSQEEEDSLKEQQSPKELVHMKNAKYLAISMTTKAAALQRDLKSVRLDLSFMQERCAMLEEENMKLRQGFAKGTQPEEDDLVRLQLEALLAEKSRLANENANLKRENQCLHQLVEYHQVTSQDLSASYDNLVSGMCLGFGSPVSDGCENGLSKKSRVDVSEFSKSLDECYDEEQQD